MELSRPKKKKPVKVAEPSIPPPRVEERAASSSTLLKVEEEAPSFSEVAQAPSVCVSSAPPFEDLPVLEASALFSPVHSSAPVSYPSLLSVPALSDLDEEGLVRLHLPMPQLVVAENADEIGFSGRLEFEALLRRHRAAVERHFAAAELRQRLGRQCASAEESDACWTRDTRFVTEKRLCGDGVAVEERHEFTVVSLRPEKLKELGDCLEQLKESSFRTTILAAFEMDTSYEDLVQFLHDFFVESGLSKSLDASRPVVAWRYAEQPPQWIAVSFALRHFVDVLVAESVIGQVPALFRRSLEELLRLVVAPLQRIWTESDVVRVWQRLINTPNSGWAASVLQLPVFGDIGHVGLSLRLLDDLLTAPALTKLVIREDESDWVVMRQSGDSHLEGGIQSQDDLELLFAQVPLVAMTEFSLRYMSEADGLQAGVHAIRLLLSGAKRFSMFDHFCKLLGNSALRLLQIWAGACGSVQSEALCKKCFGELLKVRSMWCFLRDVPYALCSLECVSVMFDSVLIANGGSVELGSFAATLGSASMQNATHLLSALERMGSAHPRTLGKRAVDVLLQIGFVCPASSALTHRAARELLGTLCSSLEELTSHLLALVGSSGLWSVLLFVLRQLPLNRWSPTEGDLEVIKLALQQAPESDASKAARQLVDGLNLGWLSDEGLAVSAELHRSLALIAVDTMVWHDNHLAKTNSWVGWKWLNNGASTSLVELYDWIWRLAERVQHRDLAGKPLLAPLDLSSPSAALLRPKPAEEAQEMSNSSSLAAWMTVCMACTVSGSAAIPLLARLASCPNPRAEVAFWRALADAAPVLAVESDSIVSSASELIRAVMTRGITFLDQPWLQSFVGSGKPRNDGLSWLALLSSRQIAAAATTIQYGGKEAAWLLCGFWSRLLVLVLGWPRIPMARSALNAVARAAILYGCFGAVVAGVGVREVALSDLPEVGAAGSSWSPISLIPAFFASSSWAAMRERLVGWAIEAPYLTLVLMARETKRQLSDWRLYGRTGEQVSPVRDANQFAIFQWAFVCEHLAATDCDSLVLYFQCFFALYFERSPSGRTFAQDLIKATDQQLVSRLAGSLERLSARTNSPLFNAFALWLRFEGMASVLVDSWASLPASMCGPQLLRRFTSGQSLFADKEADLWTDLLPGLDRSRAELQSRLLTPISVMSPPPPASTNRKIQAKLAGFSQTEPAPAPPLAEWRANALNGWLVTASGLRGALITELDIVEQVAKDWNDGWVLTTALNFDIVDAVKHKYSNVDDAHVVNKHCAKGPLDCARMAQFVFKGTKVVTSKHQVDRLKSLHVEIGKALPRSSDLHKAVAASVRLNRLIALLLRDDSLHSIGKEVFFRLIDMAAAAPFPPLVVTSAALCERLAARFAPEEKMILDRMLERPDRVRWLLPFFVPHQAVASFVDMYAQASDKKALGSESLQAQLLSQFKVSEWLSRGGPSLSEAVRLLGISIKGIDPHGSCGVLHQQTVALLARYKYPHMLVAVTEALLENENRLRFEAWQGVLLEGDLFSSIKEKTVVAQLVAKMKEFLWQKRSLANPPRGLPILEACPFGGAALAQLSCQLALCKAFRDPDPSEPYGLLHRADPESAWQVLAQLMLPFVQTLSVRPEQRPTPAVLVFPPWKGGSNDSAAELVRHVWGPTLSQLTQMWPRVVLRPLFDWMVELVPCSPLNVQVDLCAMFATCVPWELLDACDEAFVRNVGQLYANFKSPSSLGLQSALIARLPLFAAGSVAPPDATLLQVSRLVLSTVFGVFSVSGDLSAPHVLAVVSTVGLGGSWKTCSSLILPQLVQFGVEWILDWSRRALEEKLDARMSISSCLNVLENIAIQDEPLWNGPILMGQLLTCTHLPRDCIHPLVKRSLMRSLITYDPDRVQARLLFRLFNHPLFALSPGIEAALSQCLHDQPLVALVALETSCAVISGADKLATACEQCLEAYFGWSSDWSDALKSFTPPELDPEEFFEAAVRDQCVLTLVACCLKNRDAGRLVAGWLQQLRVTPGMSWKMPLLWALEVSVMGAHESLLRSWQELSRDTNSNAVVSLLGFGEKSPFPLEFRLFCRLLRNFVTPDTKDLKLIQQAKPGQLDEVVVWIERHKPPAKALELVQMTGPILFPNTKIWVLP